MKRNNSNVNNLVNNNFLKGKSFSDFQNLELEGSVKYLSYGDYLEKNKNTTREQRQKAIKNYYYNCK